MKFEITTVYSAAGGEVQPPPVNGFGLASETRIGRHGRTETFWVCEINSVEELIALCNQVAGETLSYGDLILDCNHREPGQYPLLLIYDYYRG